MNKTGLDYLESLEKVIEERKTASAEKSYTARLYSSGGTRIAQKVGEEAVELVIAAVQKDRGRMIGEAADLLYHLLVLLRFNDIRLADAVAELQLRQRR
jgi:phosphoribosyl-ATP pyrophosphohydrolase